MIHLVKINQKLYKNDKILISNLIITFIILIIISFYISIKSNHIFGRILSIGVGINLFISVVTNTAMITGLMRVIWLETTRTWEQGTANATRVSTPTQATKRRTSCFQWKSNDK